MDAHGADQRGRAGAALRRPGDLHAVFTKRRADLRRHAGEISFPGGRQDSSPTRTCADRAARGRGGDRAAARRGRAGRRPASRPATFVTDYRDPPVRRADRARQRLEPAARPRSTRSSSSRCPTCVPGYEMKRLVRRGVPIKTPTYTIDDHLIWGATAGSCRPARAARAASLSARQLRSEPLPKSELPPRSRNLASLDVLLDRDVDHVAPLGPGAVVVLDVVLAEQLVQHEPGVRRALADPAVGDDRRRR